MLVSRVVLQKRLTSEVLLYIVTVVFDLLNTSKHERIEISLDHPTVFVRAELRGIKTTFVEWVVEGITSDNCRVATLSSRCNWYCRKTLSRQKVLLDSLDSWIVGVFSFSALPRLKGHKWQSFCLNDINLSSFSSSRQQKTKQSLHKTSPGC